MAKKKGRKSKSKRTTRRRARRGAGGPVTLTVTCKSTRTGKVVKSSCSIPKNVPGLGPAPRAPRYGKGVPRSLRSSPYFTGGRSAPDVLRPPNPSPVDDVIPSAGLSGLGLRPLPYRYSPRRGYRGPYRRRF